LGALSPAIPHTGWDNNVIKGPTERSTPTIVLLNPSLSKYTGINVKYTATPIYANAYSKIKTYG